MGQAVFSLMGAFVGAGFASGREIVHFFSRWGAYSWLLIALSAGLMTMLMQRVMARGASLSDALPRGRLGWAGRGVMLLLLAFAGGGMTAAAGELSALTVPILHARTLGSLATLTMCAALSRRPLGALALLGRLLLPALAITLCCCMKTGGGNAALQDVSAGTLVSGAAQAAGYAGMNVLMALGVLCDVGAGRSAKEKRRIAWGTGAAFAAFLGLANAAFLPRIGEMKDAPLPMVLLMRSYGKWGYGLSALVLYLAVASTLIAVLRGLGALLPGKYAAVWAAVLAALASQWGFRDIVGKAYPVLGLLGLITLALPKSFQQNGTKQRLHVL